MRDVDALRYEYRIFAHDINLVKETVTQNFQKFATQKVQELYFVFPNTCDLNIKLRNGSLEIKKLIEVKEGFQKWKPLYADEILQQLHKIINIEKKLSYNEALNQLKQSPQITKATVNKTRTKYKNSVLCEISKVKINNLFCYTVCIEATDLTMLKEEAKKLNLLKYKNCSYVQKIAALC